MSFVEFPGIIFSLALGFGLKFMVFSIAILYGTQDQVIITESKANMSKKIRIPSGVSLQCLFSS